MKNCKISIIVPVYNSEKFLHKCLESLLTQTLDDIEIICVNDGSTDNSLKILQEYAEKDKRLKVINQENKGISGARNTAMNKAFGEYLGFVDSDDFIDRDFYERLYKNAKKENADIAVGNIIRLNNETSENMLVYNKLKTAEQTSDIFKLMTIPDNCYVCNRIYKRDFIMNNNLFFKEGVVYEDVIWSTVAASKAKKVISVPQANYYYLHNENSIVSSTEKNPKMLEDRRNAFSFYNKYIGDNNIKSPIRWQKVTDIRIFGLSILKIREIPEIKRKYYFLGLNIATIRFKNNF